MAEKDVFGIIGGLKNAVERGESLEKAKLTFINAGYAKEDVEQAARYLETSAQVRSVMREMEKEKWKKPEKKQVSVPSMTALSIPAAEPEKIPRMLAPQNEKPLPEMPKLKKKKHGFVSKVLIVVAVIIFLLILNIVRALIFK